MKILLDTNIIIHREAAAVINQDIGQLFNWLDRLKYEKCLHPLTLKEIENNKDEKTVKTMRIKVDSYHVLKTTAPIQSQIQDLIDNNDKSDNDRIDSKILNEVLSERVDFLITEDKGVIRKANRLGVKEKVLSIDEFLQKVLNENPDLIDYNVLSISKQFFGDINLEDSFFDTFRDDYVGFNQWFNRKSDEEAYLCSYQGEIAAFLYVKVEDADESYYDVSPQFEPKKRLKIGTMKVSLNGLRLGERLLKIVFDNALVQKAKEIYVTIFNHRIEQNRLIDLLEEFGFVLHGIKNSSSGEEHVYVRNFQKIADPDNPLKTFPYVSRENKVFIVPIYPEYHTELLPDSILRTESPQHFEEPLPHRNAIRKSYISHSWERNINTGDIIVFYRTGGRYKGVATSVGIVEKVHDEICTLKELQEITRKRTVLSKDELYSFWNRYPDNKPFVVDFLYAHSFPKRPNLNRLIELRVIKDIDNMPRGFREIEIKDFNQLLNFVYNS